MEATSACLLGLGLIRNEQIEPEFHRNRGTCQEYFLRVSYIFLLSLIPEGFLLEQLLRA